MFLERNPRLKLLLWQALSVSLLIAIVLVGVALAVPTVTFSSSLSDLLNACVMAIRAQYATPGGAVGGVVGLVLVAAVVVRGATVLISSCWSTRSARNTHRDALAILGRSRIDLGITVIENGNPAAYCLPGHHGQIVVTSGALESLDDGELAAVLAHERAHLAARHHLAVGFAVGVRRAFPFVPLFRDAASEAARIVELLADDAASRATGRRPVATALVALASSPTPAVALGAGGSDAVGRVERMMTPHRPLGVFASGGVAIVALLTMSAPFVVAAEPAAAATTMNLCPLDPAPVVGSAALDG
jgi:Zn-dependent protease with chaperone function